MLQTVVRPSDRDFRTTSLDGSSMDDRRRLLHAIAVGHIDRIAVSVPGKPDGGGWVIPPEINPSDALVVFGQRDGLPAEAFLGHREDAARSQRRNALGPRL